MAMTEHQRLKYYAMPAMVKADDFRYNVKTGKRAIDLVAFLNLNDEKSKKVNKDIYKMIIKMLTYNPEAVIIITGEVKEHSVAVGSLKEIVDNSEGIDYNKSIDENPSNK